MSQKTSQIILVFIGLITISMIVNSWDLSHHKDVFIFSETKYLALTREVRVRASQGWLNTEILVQPGDVLTIQYLSGLWAPWSAEGYDGIGSGGDPNCSCNLMMGVSHAALIGRIGDGDPFLIGNQFRQPTGASGYLQLGINDIHLHDNSGSLLVRITVSQQK